MTSGWAPASETSPPRAAGTTVTWRASTSKASLAMAVADRIEQALALGVGDRAADHDPVRVERVDVADAARPRRPAEPGP